MTNEVIARLDKHLNKSAAKSDKPAELVYVNVFINSTDAEGNAVRIPLPFNSGLVNMPDKEEKGSPQWIQEAQASNAFKTKLVEIAFEELEPGETMDLTTDNSPGTIGVELYRKKDAVPTTEVGENPHMAALQSLTFTKKSA